MRMYVTKSGLWISWEFMQSKWLHKSWRKILTLTFPTISEQQVRGHGSSERIVRDFVLCNFQTWIPYYMWWWTFSVIESLIALFDISYYINFRLGFMYSFGWHQMMHKIFKIDVFWLFFIKKNRSHWHGLRKGPKYGPKSAKSAMGQRVLYTIWWFLASNFGAFCSAFHKFLDFQFWTFFQRPPASKVE